MAQFHPAWLEYRRKYFIRPNGNLRLRPNAHLSIRHDAYRFMPPGSPLYVGKDVVRYFWPDPVCNQPLQSEDVVDPAQWASERAELSAIKSELAELIAIRRERAELQAIKRELAKIRFEIKFRRLLRDFKAGFNPNQPRVPAGSREGGQWTNGGGADSTGKPERQVIRDHTGRQSWEAVINEFASGGSLSRQTVVNRDGSAIRSDFATQGTTDWDERHTVLLADGSVTTFQNSGDTQTIIDGSGQTITKTDWTDDGPEPQATVQQVFLGPVAQGGRIAIQKGIEAGLALYAWLSSRNGAQGQAVFAFRSGEYRREGTAEQPKAIWVGRLTRDEVNDACRKLDDVQDRTDQAVKEVTRSGDYKGPADFGTKVHKELARGINGLGDSNYRAEVSLIKTKLETDADYGERGSIRVDVFENRPATSTVCVYDPKTGNRGLDFPRMNEIAQTVQRVYPTTQRIIITEIRPNK